MEGGIVRAALIDNSTGSEIGSAIFEQLPRPGDMLDLIRDGKQIMYTVDRVHHVLSQGANDGSVFRKHVFGAQQINLFVQYRAET